jgi:UDP-N-acetylglucosamine diphosphorylase/glucosamine-1-phosphate N-acetyltransferase
MPAIIFTEEFCQPENLRPFTLTRQIQDIRVGILTIREKWEKGLGISSFDKFEDDYKDLDRSIHVTTDIPDDKYLLIHGNLLPSIKLIKAVKTLKPGEFISVNDTGVVFCFTPRLVGKTDQIKVNKSVIFKETPDAINFPWDIFQLNDTALRFDFNLLTAGRKSQPISKSNTGIKHSQIFIEKGAIVESCILNASEGPIYIGKNAIVMEGSCLRGPVSIGKDAVVKMGTKIYGATSIGPGCLVGGEIKNSVLFAHSNKAHDGYLGDSVIGEWCNMGAGTNNSNLKNNAGEVRVWTSKGNLPAGKKCGFFMGDYSRTAINTAINTGTVIGTCCNVFGNGLTPKYIPSFSWGSEGVKRYEYEKAINDIGCWKKFKNHSVSENEKSILKYIFEHY